MFRELGLQLTLLVTVGVPKWPSALELVFDDKL